MELGPFIESHRQSFLVTRTAAGGPTAHPMTLIPHDATIYFNTYRKSAKVRNLARDARMACLATAPTGPEWVAVQGRAEVVGADLLPPGVLGGASSAVMGEEELARVRERLATGKRVYLRVEPSVTVEGGEPPPFRGAGAPPPASAAVGGARPWEHTLRPSPIAMTAQEVDDFVRGHDVAAFAWLAADGSPRVAMARYAGGPGDLAVRLAGPTVAPAPDGPVCLTVDEFPTYNEIRGVMVHGTAHATGGAVHVVPERVVSFDFRKVSGSGSGR